MSSDGNLEKAKPKPVSGRKRSHQSVAARRLRVFELKCRGFTARQICEKLTEEGIVCSENEVYNDLRSEAVVAFVEELVRQQLLDITLARQDDLEAALKYRDLLIEKLLPQKSVESNVKVNVSVGQQQGTSTADLLERYERLVKSGVVGNIPANHTEESVDHSETHG